MFVTLRSNRLSLTSLPARHTGYTSQFKFRHKHHQSSQRIHIKNKVQYLTQKIVYFVRICEFRRVRSKKFRNCNYFLRRVVWYIGNNAAKERDASIFKTEAARPSAAPVPVVRVLFFQLHSTTHTHSLTLSFTVRTTNFHNISKALFFFHCATTPCGPRLPHDRGFTNTLRHTTFGRIPLDE